MTFKSVSLCSTFVALTLGYLVAEDKPTPKAGESVVDSSEAHKIIDRMVEAIGGEEAVKGIQTRVASGVLSMRV